MPLKACFALITLVELVVLRRYSSTEVNQLTASPRRPGRWVILRRFMRSGIFWEGSTRARFRHPIFRTIWTPPASRTAPMGLWVLHRNG